MNKKLIISISLVAIILLAIVVYNNIATKQEVGVESVKIGAIIPLSGKAAYWGEVNDIGIKLAVEKINAQYGDNSIEVIIEDSQSDSGAAVDAANKLINLDQVDIVYTELSGPSGAVSPVARAASKLFMYDAFSPAALEDNPLAIKTFLDQEAICYQYAQSAKVKGFDKVAVVADAVTGLSPYCVDGLRSVFVDEQVLVSNISLSDDLRSVVLKAKDANVDSIIFIGYESSSQSILKLRSELAWQVEYFTIRTNVSDKFIDEMGFGNLSNIIVFDTKINDDFAAGYLKNSSEVNISNIQGAAFAHDAIIALFVGSQRCQDNAQCVVDEFISQDEFVTAIDSYANYGRSLVPEVEYFEIKDQQVQKIEL